MTSKHLFTSFNRIKNGYKYNNKHLNNITMSYFSSKSHDRE